MRKLPAFSLLELMVSVTIVLILFVIAIPRLSFLDKYFLYREQDLLCATLTYVQHKAIVTNKSYVVSFDLNKNTYSYQYPKNKIKTYVLQCGVSFGFLSGAKGPPSKPDAVITQKVTFDALKKDPKVTCLPNGMMTPGTIYLLDKKKTTMVAITIGITEVACIRRYAYEQDRWVMES